MKTHPCSTDPGIHVANAVSDTGLNMRAPSLESTANGAACEDLWPTNDTGRSASSPKFGPALSADVGTENKRSEANGWKYRRRPTDPKGDRARPMMPSMRVKDSPATYIYGTCKIADKKSLLYDHDYESGKRWRTGHCKVCLIFFVHYIGSII